MLPIFMILTYFATALKPESCLNEQVEGDVECGTYLVG